MAEDSTWTPHGLHMESAKTMIFLFKHYESFAN
jgi:hypothetical protein